MFSSIHVCEEKKKKVLKAENARVSRWKKNLHSFVHKHSFLSLSLSPSNDESSNMSRHVIRRYSIMSFQGVVKVDEKRHSFIVHLFSTMPDKRDIFSYFFCSRRISDQRDLSERCRGKFSRAWKLFKHNGQRKRFTLFVLRRYLPLTRVFTFFRNEKKNNNQKRSFSATISVCSRCPFVSLCFVRLVDNTHKMVDLSFRSSLCISSELFTVPSNRQYRRLLPPPQSSMFVSASPLAANNKIRPTPTRKPRITLQAYYDFTDIRSININNAAGITSSSANFSTLNPEKLVERSQDIRLGRIAPRQTVRPSLLSSTSTLNQQSFVWPSYNSPVLTPTRNRSPTAHMPDIHQRPSRAQTLARAPFTDPHNILTSAEPRHKSLTKTKAAIPRAYQRTISKSKSPYPTSRSQAMPAVAKEVSKPVVTATKTPIRMCESEEDDDEEEQKLLTADAEYEDYVEKAMVKCADWLIKYVFDQKYEDIEE